MSQNKSHTKIIITGEPKSGKSRLAAIIHNALITSHIQHFDVEVKDGEDFAINPHRLPMPVTGRDTPQDILITVVESEDKFDNFGDGHAVDVINPFAPRSSDNHQRFLDLYVLIKKEVTNLHVDLWEKTECCNGDAPLIHISAPADQRVVKISVETVGEVVCPLHEIGDIMFKSDDIESDVLEYFLQKYMQLREDLILAVFIKPEQIDWALDFIETVAEKCHTMNAAYCRDLGDDSQPSWPHAPDWQKASAIKGVVFHLAHPDAGPEASHNEWLKEKAADGWEYGEVKDPDKKTHPCFVNFEKLPPEQQYKDVLFKAVVEAERTKTTFVWPDKPIADNNGNHYFPDPNKKPLGMYSEEGSKESEQEGFDSMGKSIPEIEENDHYNGKTDTLNFSEAPTAIEKELEDDSNVVHDSEVEETHQGGYVQQTEGEAKIDLELKAREDGIELDRRMTLDNMRKDYELQYGNKYHNEDGT